MPDKTVIGFSGDGGAMYTIQAMWTAAHHDIGAKFVVCNNRSYQLLKLNVQQYWRERGFDGSRFSGLVSTSASRRSASTSSRASMGVPLDARRDRRRGRARDRSRRVDEDGPFLIDLVAAPGGARTIDEDAANRRPVAGTRAHS